MKQKKTKRMFPIYLDDQTYGRAAGLDTLRSKVLNKRVSISSVFVDTFNDCLTTKNLK